MVAWDVVCTGILWNLGFLEGYFKKVIWSSRFKKEKEKKKKVIWCAFTYYRHMAIIFYLL
jgi:hypothetical protein